MVAPRLRALLLTTLIVLTSSTATAQPPSEPEPSSPSPANAQSNAPSSDGLELEKLLDEAQQLFVLKQSIDARSKLLKALQIAPKDYRPHLLLGAYYLSEVGHFQLAYRYILTAEKLFTEQYGDESDQANPSSPRVRKPFPFSAHARLLYLLSEARLNLDDYQGALDTLDRFEKLYWDDWYPGTRAWVLMKLKRVDEAITTAQRGILLGAEPTRTYNILGILLSLKNNRELSLQAFTRAIRAEYSSTGTRQAATPLNNAGEVYSEMFQDRMAEAAWIQALRMPDGCDHVLPSLNLTILYINELRLHQAERALADFESCYAQHATRTDTEHRALLALARGRIALRAGKIEKARELIQNAADRQQWFGKIGTDPEDLKFAATVSLAQAYRATAARLGDRASSTWRGALQLRVDRAWALGRAWWLERRARAIEVQNLNNLEDMSIRNTDAMLEYPTFGQALRAFPPQQFEKRIGHAVESDQRPTARKFYQLYLATNFIEHGQTVAAHPLLEQVSKALRPFDRLQRAELLAQQIALEQGSMSWFDSRSETLSTLIEDLFDILPSHIRVNDLTLPIARIVREGQDQDAMSELSDMLLSRRFEIDGAAPEQRRYHLVVAAPADASRPWQVTLWDNRLNLSVVHVTGTIDGEKLDLPKFYNKVIDGIFSHRADPASEALPELTILPTSKD